MSAKRHDTRITGKVGVIDIGSNSVRLVVYDALKRAPLPLINEKTLCGLARDMEQTGLLYGPGVNRALDALGRFAILLKAAHVEDVMVFATAAVRDAKDGAAFVEHICAQYGFKVHVVSGAEEARLAALGVAAGFFHTQGVVGDLGGGSFELAKIDSAQNTTRKIPYRISKTKSYPIGQLRLAGKSGGDLKKARRLIDDVLKRYHLAASLKGHSFFAVGGGFRALAKVHMRKQRYPLDVLHHYTIPARALQETAQWVAGLPTKTIAKQRLVSSSRTDTIALTALVMDRVIALGKPSDIAFSVHGVREGVLCNRLSHKEHAKDALLTACEHMMQHLSPQNSTEWVRFGYELFAWMDPLFNTETPDIKRLRKTACVLSRLSWYEHTAYRAEMAFRWVMDSAIPALGHEERVFVATCAFHRYNTQYAADVMAIPHGLLQGNLAFRAQIIGAAMQLGYAIAEGTLGVLPKTALRLKDNNTVILSATQKNRRILFNDRVWSQLQQLGTLAGLRARIE